MTNILKKSSLCLLSALLSALFLTGYFSGSSVSAVAVDGHVNICSQLTNDNYATILTNANNTSQTDGSYVIFQNQFGELFVVQSANAVKITNNGYISTGASTSLHNLNQSSPYQKYSTNDFSSDFSNYRLSDDSVSACVYIAHNWDKSDFGGAYPDPNIPDPFAVETPPTPINVATSATLKVGTSNSDSVCPLVDVSRQYVSYINNPDTWHTPTDFDDHNSLSYIEYLSFRQAISSGYVAAVQHVDNSSDTNPYDGYRVYIYWSNDSTSFMSMVTPGYTAINHSIHTAFLQYTGGSPGDTTCQSHIELSFYGTSGPTSLVSIGTPNPSSGGNFADLPYFSTFPRDSTAPTNIPDKNPSSNLHPTFTYDIKDKHIILRNITPGFGAGQTCHWEIDNKPGSNPDVDGYDVMQGDLPCDTPVEHDFAQYGSYYVQLYIVDDGVTNMTEKTFDIDGSSQKGTVGTVSYEKPHFEDCSVYSGSISQLKTPDLIGGIACVMRNFWVTVTDFITSLFVPDIQKVSDAFDELKATFIHSVGFLWYPFQFIIDLLNLFISQTTNPTGAYCYIGDVAAFHSGSTPLYLCKWRDQLPGLWSIMQITARAGIALVVVSMLFRKLSSIIGGSSDGDDGDEVSGTSYVGGRSKGMPF